MNNKGFSLIELMIVVGIIGVLATVAVPKFKTFQVKAKLSEAKVVLNHIGTLQEAYALENTLFKGLANATTWYGFVPSTGAGDCSDTDADTLGFKIEPCDSAATGGKSPRFAYNILAGTGTAAADWRATAHSGTNAFNRVNPMSTSKGEKLDIDETKTITQRCDTISQAIANGGTCDNNAVAL